MGNYRLFSRTRYRNIELEWSRILNSDRSKKSKFRLIILDIHLYIEIWMERIIKKIFPNSKIILDDNPMNQLKTFSNKLRLLEALGVFSDPIILKDIRIVNKIRNSYTHTFDYKSISKSIDSEILKLTIPKNAKHNGDLLKYMKKAHHRLQVCAIMVLLRLEDIYKRVKKF